MKIGEGQKAWVFLVGKSQLSKFVEETEWIKYQLVGTISFNYLKYGTVGPFEVPKILQSSRMAVGEFYETQPFL
jgi:hypothetical protein